METFYILNILLGALISLILGPLIIPELIKLKIGQSIREDGPQGHLVKSGTPTMGGVIFLISTIVTLLILGIEDNRVYICIISMLGFGLIGLIDDYLIVIKKNNEGLTAKQKFSLQFVMAIIVIAISSQNMEVKEFMVPFLLPKTVNLGVFYYPIALFIILGTVNSVNLTDGLDGLATSVSIISLISYGIILIALGKGELAMFSVTLAGALIGFLRFNRYPARIFMGDVGSLAIGGAFAAIALESSSLFFLPIFGIIFVVETLSVIIQVISFKTRGKRVFLMSPLHHHYEEKGHHETKIVRAFSIVTIIAGIIGIIAIF